MSFAHSESVSGEDYHAIDLDSQPSNLPLKFNKPVVNNNLDTPESPVRSEIWKICGERLPESQITYTVQVTILFIIICVSLAKLCWGAEDKSIWTTLLCTSIGYILPSPKIKTTQRTKWRL